MSPPAADLLIDLILPEACTAVTAVAIGPISLWAFVDSNESSIVTLCTSAISPANYHEVYTQVELVYEADNL